jgi:hypothetical protein
LIDDDETYEPVSENNDDYDDDINFEENSNSSCDEKEDISKVLKANQKYFQNGLKMNFKEKEFEDAFEDIPDSYFKKNIMDLSTEVSIDFDSIEIFCKNPKYININKGIVDLGLYCTDLKKKGIIYLGTLNGIAIILKFPTSYDTFLVFNDYLESIFELNNISLPRSQDDINFNYKIKRIRINNEIFNDIISRFFKKLKNENHYEKKGNIERIHFIDEEKKGNIKIIFESNGLKGNLDTVRNLLEGFQSKIFFFYIDICISFKNKCINTSIDEFKKYEYQILENIQNYHSTKFYKDWGDEEDFKVLKINIYNNIKGIYLGNNKKNTVFKNNEMNLIHSKITRANKFDLVRSEVINIKKELIKNITNSSLRLEFKIVLENYNEIGFHLDMILRIKRIFDEIIPMVVPKITNLEEINFEKFDNILEEFEKEIKVERLFDLNDQLITFLTGRVNRHFKNYDSFKKFYQKEILEYEIKNCPNIGLFEFNENYLEKSEKPSKTKKTWKEYFEIILKVEKKDFRNIDLSKINYTSGEKISYKKYVFEIKELDLSIKELNQEEINNLENLIFEKMESSNWNKLVELNKNKKEVKEKKFKDWIEPIKTAFKEDIPMEIYYKYFKKFNLQVVPSLREMKEDGTLLFRNDRSFILKFPEEKKNYF